MKSNEELKEEIQDKNAVLVIFVILFIVSVLLNVYIIENNTCGDRIAEVEYLEKKIEKLEMVNQIDFKFNVGDSVSLVLNNKIKKGVITEKIAWETNGFYQPYYMLKIGQHLYVNANENRLISEDYNTIRFNYE